MGIINCHYDFYPVRNRTANRQHQPLDKKTNSHLRRYCTHLTPTINRLTPDAIMTFSQKKIHAAITQQHTNFFPLVRNAELDSAKKRRARSWTLFFFDAHICPKGILLSSDYVKYTIFLL